MVQSFVDRDDAGRRLAQKLLAYRNDPDVIVIGLPRGGMIPAALIAKELHVPLDIVVPRKVGALSHSELAVGAVMPSGQMVWNEQIVKSLHIQHEDMADAIKKQHAEAQRRLVLYRQGRPPLILKDKIVILVDDGIATGATMRAAIAYAKQQGAKKIVVATPVATVDILEQIEQEVDEVVSVLLPKTFLGISAFYESFPQTEDDEVIALMQK